jgi:hypothetical protein
MKERREEALRKERIRTLESEIDLLEKEQLRLESSFSHKTAAEDYFTYAENAERIRDAYDEYLKLTEEIEKAPDC